MKHLFAVLALLFVQKFDDLDRWLCTKTPWHFRLWWCAQWVRKDVFHPSLDTDSVGAMRKQDFFCKILKFKMDIFRLKPRNLMTKDETTRETLRLNNLRAKIFEKYYADLERRREIARKRDPENQISNNPSA